MLMKLYKVSTYGLGDFYVLARNMGECEELLYRRLNEADTGFQRDRAITQVNPLGKMAVPYSQGNSWFIGGEHNLILPGILMEVVNEDK